MLRRFALGAFCAWLVFVGIVLGRFADDAMPAYYVLRPLAVSSAAAFILGIVAAVLPGPSAILGVLLAGTMAIGGLALPFLAGLLVLTSAYALPAIRQRLQLERLGVAALVLTIAFASVGLARAAALTPWQVRTPPSHVGDRPDDNLYLFLLDGYPRADSLAELGIGNDRFLDQLRRRGFDIYPHATTEHSRTELTLLSLLGGTSDGVPTASDDAATRRAVRERISAALPDGPIHRAGYELVVIDSPIGHVTFEGGRHIQPGGMNNFEAGLLADSALAPLLTSFAPKVPMDSLRHHLESSLAATGELAERQRGIIVLTHLIAPHLPFLYDANGETAIPSYWPRVQLFESVVDIIGISMTEYVGGYAENLYAVNDRLVAAVDRVMSADPDARIVLFSDHGARYTFQNRGEWTRSFLAVRTTRQPRLLGEAPVATELLCDLLSTCRERR